MKGRHLPTNAKVLLDFVFLFVFHLNNDEGLTLNMEIKKPGGFLISLI